MESRTPGDSLIELASLTEDFWSWRSENQPDSSDDIPRVERPVGWRADWSPNTVAARRLRLRAFAARFATLDLSDSPVPVQVDGRLLGSALSRAHWELEILRSWQRDPRFYLDQSLVPLYNELLRPGAFDDRRTRRILLFLRNVPTVLEHARLNLGDQAAASFAEYSVTMIDGLPEALGTAMAELAVLIPDEHSAALASAAKAAATAVAAFRNWLTSRLPDFRGPASVGLRDFSFYLHRVALLPYSSTRLLEMGAQEWSRAVAAELAVTRRADDSVAALPTDISAHIARQARDELAVRKFYLDRGLLSQPDELRHYRFEAMPRYLNPLTRLGVAHFAGTPSDPSQDAIHYAVDPAETLPYFRLAEARDPRTAIIHEGVHSQQLALSWAHPNPARRRFYDSTPNEGLAFYNEELMFLSGLFDDEPTSARFAFNAMRLRALRVEVDVTLAAGQCTIDQAAEILRSRVPMDRQTAWEEATFFAGNPGQGLSYQIGKLQINDMLADCRRQPGFSLQDFHDRLWREGNVPIVLQRWELLGSREHLDEVDRLAAQL